MSCRIPHNNWLHHKRIPPRYHCKAVPTKLLTAGKSNGEYVVFDPTGMQVIPANSNAQRLGVGGVVVDIIRKVIIINRENKPAPKRVPEKKKEEPPVRKKGEITVR